MKILKCFISFTLIFSAELYAQWENKIHREDDKYHYYVGVGVSETLNKAMEEAYINAVKEATRSHFGFESTMSQSIFESIDKSEINGNHFLKGKEVNLQGITPSREKVVEEDGKYTVYREIQYTKLEILKEKNRIRHKVKKNKLNHYNQNGGHNGQLRIETKPSGADFILTKKNSRGSIHGHGDALVSAEIGEYDLTLLKPGYYPYRKAIFISGKKSRIGAVLEPRKASFKVSAKPIDASIYLNGRLIENNKVYELSILFDYILRVEHADYLQQSQRLELSEDNLNLTEVTLEAKRGSISIYSQTKGATIYLDGEDLGEGPIKKRQLSAGEHEVRLEKSGYITEIENIEIEPNRDMEPIILELRKESKIDKVRSKFHFKNNDEDRDESVFQFIYNPIITELNKTSYYTYPLGLNLFIFRYLSLGFDYRYTQFESKDDNGYDITKEYSALSINTKLFLVRSKSFNLALGYEYNTRTIQLDEDTTSSEYHDFEPVTEQTYGHNVTLQLPMNNTFDSGFQFEYRLLDERDPSSSSTSLGVYFGF